ncbi:hypothetical protein P175DRAFT_0285795 [Aspergillus ochraceoroseus IBT 24754]|uniref:F-box domain-containing protein n=2 Tax=Aspergillus ochraceoroseus TaxID=138278 RepID=A0A2T5LS22_9EURO|nr:uncharacterized protein P175DRAFT_0285795 [Aspergillus ochraceoroseus IBT 24754]KKK17905.1 hypothetical protein AOCH_001685 [Aspergillus ochraceoroseus]PTU19074.1 hypothetical protein P175DRAFT_0285795 [Aspergillus ochraceoroseus IBT 24754]
MPPVRRSRRTLPSNSGITSKNSSLTTRTRALRSSARLDPQPSISNPEKPASTQRKKKSLPSYFQRPQREIAQDPNRCLRLFSLPREIFDEIVSHLPPDAEACFTLTCKEALNSIGTGSWAHFRGRARRYGSHGSLGELLQRDLPGYEYCPRCETLHPPIKPPYAHRVTRLTKLCLGQDGVLDIWPQSQSGGYSIVFAHIREAFASQPASTATSPPIDIFSGEFTHHTGSINYMLRSQAHWIDKNLVIIQEHRLRSAKPQALAAGDVISLPFRVCAHLSTTTDPPPNPHRARKPSVAANGPLLPHAITTAFPAALRKGIPRGGIFRTASPAEQAQMKAADAGEDVTWRCRSCPTKFRITYQQSNGGECIVKAWHCFGRALYKAVDFWKFSVRREGPTLGHTKRNSEYLSPVRSLPDFKIT